MLQSYKLTNQNASLCLTLANPIALLIIMETGIYKKYCAI